MTGRLDHLGIHLHCRNFSASPKGTRGFPVALVVVLPKLTSTVHLSDQQTPDNLRPCGASDSSESTEKQEFSSQGDCCQISWLEPSDQNQGPPKVRPTTVIIRELQYITTEKLLLCFSAFVGVPARTWVSPAASPSSWTAIATQLCVSGPLSLQCSTSCLLCLPLQLLSRAQSTTAFPSEGQWLTRDFPLPTQTKNKVETIGAHID